MDRMLLKLKKISGLFLIRCFMFIIICPLSVSAANNESIIYNYLVSEMGLNNAVACGVLANIEHESSFNPTLEVKDTNGLYSLGICQWNGARRTALLNYAGNNSRTIAGQLSYLKYELSTSEKNAWNNMNFNGIPNTADGASIAAERWARYFERCAKYTCFASGKLKGYMDRHCASCVDQYISRQKKAKDYYWPKYGNGGDSTSTNQNNNYPACSSSHTSIVSALQSIGVDSSFSNRANIAAINGISNYAGTAEQNIHMLNLLKQGKLIKTKGSTVQRDITPPTISDVRITDKSSTGYTVHCIVRDNSALSYVTFPTWTPWNNGQDDITWDRANVAGTSWELNYRVNTSAHKNETNCWYVTHIYAYDTAGNCTSVSAGDVYIENQAPQISNVKVTNISDAGYIITCTVTDNDSINRVQFPTWTENKGQDDIDSGWWTSTKSRGNVSGSTYTFRVNTSEHNNEKGNYITHIYAFDSCGNYTCSAVPYVNVNNSLTIHTKSNQTIFADCFIKNYGDKAFSLGAKTSGDGKLTFSSSNTKIATVSSSGTVTIKGIGIANITIVAAGTSVYNSATKTITVTVRPKSTSISSLKNSKSKKLTITWKRNSTVTGYMLQIATNSSFSNAKSYTIKRNKTVRGTVSVSKGNTYYVRICTYKGALTSDWSSTKELTITK